MLTIYTGKQLEEYLWNKFFNVGQWLIGVEHRT